MKKISPVCMAFVLAALVGATTVDGEFVYDDTAAIVGSPVVTGDVPAAEAFTRSFWGRPLSEESYSYRPLTPFIWSAIWSASPGNPLPFRLFSLLLHVAAVTLFWQAGLALGAKGFSLAAAVLIFAVHPLHAEAVGAIIGQADMTGACFGLLAVILCSRPSSMAALPAAAASLLLGCLAKESTFLFVFPCLWVVLLRKDLKRTGKITGCALLGAVAFSVVIVQLSIERGTEHWNNSLVYGTHGWGRILLGLYFLGRAFVLCFVPVGQSPVHGYGAIDPSFQTLRWYALLGAAALVIFGVTGWRLVHRRRLLPGAVWMMLLGPLLLISSLIVRMPTDLPERILYPASMAASAVAAALLGLVTAERRRAALLAVLVVAYALSGFAAQRPWHSDRSLWEHAVAAQPKAIRGQYNLSDVRLGQGLAEEAAWHRLLAAWVNDSYPRRVDWEPVRHLEETLPPFRRVIDAPGVLAPSDPCRLVQGVLGVYNRTLPALVEQAQQSYRDRYHRCFKSTAE